MSEKEKAHTEGQLIQLRLGDSIEILKSMPDASIGAVICDPPYG